MTTDLHTAYLAPMGFENLLSQELTDISHTFGRLIVTKAPPKPAHWAQNIWYDARLITIRSIGDAAKSLRAIQRNWWHYEFKNFRRAKLIQEKLPHIAPKPLDFLAKIPTAPLGSWTLVEENILLAAANCSSPMPNGEWIFNEDKLNPPSRAYLKLWEFFTRFRIHPNKSDVVIDLGASPGGWTWVLSELAKHVIAIDRAALDRRALAPNVTFQSGDAFKVDLAEFPQASWVFSDVVCYPDKLYEFISRLLKDYPHKNYVFTIKFQGNNHLATIAKFSNLPGQLVHLSQNKHELTWFYARTSQDMGTAFK